MKKNETYKVVIADDHQLVIDGLKALIESNEKFSIVYTCSNGQSAIDYIQSNVCDVVMLDIQMPVLDGLETARILLEQFPNLPVLMLTMHDEKEFIQKALEHGARGYLLKDTTETTLIEALQHLVNGEYYFGGNVALKLADSEYVYSKGRRTKHVELSSRELEIIQLICDEFTTDEIAEKLFLSNHTIKTHRKRILQKLEVKNVAGIVRYAIENNLV
jgi:DNA-binding NarL/FixJ family response regulator